MGSKGYTKASAKEANHEPVDESMKMRPMTIEASTSAFTTYTPLSWVNSTSSTTKRFCASCSWWVLVVLGGGLIALVLVLFGSGVAPSREPSGDADIDGSSSGTAETHYFENSTPLQSEKDLIEYYNGNDLSAAFAIGNEHGLVYLARKMLKKKRAKQPFVLGAIGDGNLVGGFGNCHQDGYLSVVAKTVQASFESKGLNFELRSTTFGSFCGSSSRSSASCKNNLLGKDVDLLHFSFPHSSDTQEMRFNLGSIGDGTVHIVEPDCSGHAQSLSKGRNAKLLKEYSKFGSDVLCLEDALQTIMGESYKGQAWGLVGDGMHKTARQSSSGLVWRNWLPGPLGHQFLADCVSMLLFRTLRMMESLEKAGSENSMDVSLAPIVRAPPQCFAIHNPHFGGKEIIAVQTGSWRSLPGDSAMDDDVPADDRENPKCLHPDECGYLEARGSAAGSLVFTIPPQESLPHRKVYICCCCNAELCVGEQFRDYVQFKWSTPIPSVSPTDAEKDAETSLIAGKECLLIAKDMPFANQLTVSITTPQVNLPIRISKVIAG